MESYSSWPESSSSNQIKSIQDLIQGQELTHKFAEMFSLPNNYNFGHTSTDLIPNQASEMYNDAFSIMSDYIVNPVHQTPLNDMYSQNSVDGGKSKDIKKPVKIVKSVKNKRGCYNTKSSWTSTKLTRSTDDGHEWRKYGQKEILNAKHKRNYYRCIYKFDQGCQATKQVQKVEDEPTSYKITYHQYHTCKNFLRTPQIIIDSSDNINDTSILLSFESNGIIENKEVDSHHFPPIKHEEHKEVSSSLGLRHNQSLSFGYPSLDPLGPVSLSSSRLEHEEVISTWVSSPIYEIDHIREYQTIDFSEIPFDYYHDK